MRAVITFFAAFVLFVNNLNADTGVQYFSSHPFPAKLSQWRIFIIQDGNFNLNQGVLPYDLKNPLFSDYAEKFRTVWVPETKTIDYAPSGAFRFPVKSVLSKTFSYKKDHLTQPCADNGLTYQGDAKALSGHCLVETRLLIHTENGWIGLPYVWDEDQKDASLRLTGKSFTVSLQHPEAGASRFTYQVPNFNQCKACHIKHIEFEKPVLPIGPKAHNLNRMMSYHQAGDRNQLAYWNEKGILNGLPEKPWPSSEYWDDESAPLNDRARAWLDINCAHCHSPQGPASTSGLFLGLEVTDPSQWGLCKSPVAIGNAGGGWLFDIVPGRPEESILYFRLASEDPAIMMPEVGRSLIHRKSLNLIEAWIQNLEGVCIPPVPKDHR